MEPAETGDSSDNEGFPSEVLMPNDPRTGDEEEEDFTTHHNRAEDSDDSVDDNPSTNDTSNDDEEPEGIVSSALASFNALFESGGKFFSESAPKEYTLKKNRSAEDVSVYADMLANCEIDDNRPRGSLTQVASTDDLDSNRSTMVTNNTKTDTNLRSTTTEYGANGNNNRSGPHRNDNSSNNNGSDVNNNNNNNYGSQKSDGLHSILTNRFSTPDEVDLAYYSDHPSTNNTTSSRSARRRDAHKSVTFADGTAAPVLPGVAVGIIKHEHVPIANYMEYSIQIWQNGRSWLMPKRYSQFQQLHTDLVGEYERTQGYGINNDPEAAAKLKKRELNVESAHGIVEKQKQSGLPELPKKRWFETQRWLNRHDHMYAFMRRQALQEYLKAVVKVPNITTHSVVIQRFLDLDKTAENTGYESFTTTAGAL